MAMKDTMMRQIKQLLVIFTITLNIACTLHAATATSQTFFFVPPTYSVPMIRSFYRHAKGIVRLGAWEAVPYYSHSTNACKLTQFFMPFGKTSLTVSEYKPTVPSSTTDLNPLKDVEARHFNIETDPNFPEAFSSIITFAPEHQVIGTGFTIQQTLYKNCLEEPRLWLEVSFPVEQVKHRMNLQEEVLSTGGGAADVIGLDNEKRVGTMTEAFKQKGWKYGKIDNCTHTAQGVADVTISFNWATYFPRAYSCSGIGFVAPTGTEINAKNAEFVFAPVVGNNHHWEIIFWNQLEFDLWDCNDHSLKLYFNGRGSIIVRNHQVRSFDLDDKSWGRYMEVYSSQAAAEEAQMSANPNSGTSGINVFTLCMQIDPRYQAETKTALTYQYKGFLAEAGGGLYVRHAELFERNNLKQRTALKDVNGLGYTNNARTIGKNFPQVAITNTNDYTDAIVYLNEMNFLTATHPSIITGTVYGTIGYEWINDRAPTMLTFGSSYDFSSRNTSLNRWAIWGKCIVSF